MVCDDDGETQRLTATQIPIAVPNVQGTAFGTNEALADERRGAQAQKSSGLQGSTKDASATASVRRASRAPSDSSGVAAGDKSEQPSRNPSRESKNAVSDDGAINRPTSGTKASRAVGPSINATSALQYTESAISPIQETRQRA